MGRKRSADLCSSQPGGDLAQSARFDEVDKPSLVRVVPAHQTSSACCRRRSWRVMAGRLRPISLANFDGSPTPRASSETILRRVGSASRSIPTPLRLGIAAILTMATSPPLIYWSTNAWCRRSFRLSGTMSKWARERVSLQRVLWASRSAASRALAPRPAG